MPSFRKLTSCLLLLCCAACNTSQATSSNQQDQAAVPPRIANYSFDVVNTYPHDAGAFTQGLVYYQGLFYESTGLNGQSSLRRVEIQTGQVLKKLDVSSQFFAEGLALLNNKLYQLTWVTQTGFVYDLDSFDRRGTFGYTGEG
ncbi:MAG TPA: glutaminyl-peptide cyclotransferase, partial [Blastocatellia bacterium]|nr:glutaminyl-peptide cyclotransferase [Blastocatellia bacterium]